jgi:hypothetical protein
MPERVKTGRIIISYPPRKDIYQSISVTFTTQPYSQGKESPSALPHSELIKKAFKNVDL